MLSHELMNNLKELRNSWKKQDFRFTPEQKEEYETLMLYRRERIKQFYKEGKVSKGQNKN
jgi:hypothetical protein